jgi:hypothetical protein
MVVVTVSFLVRVSCICNVEVTLDLMSHMRF